MPVRTPGPSTNGVRPRCFSLIVTHCAVRRGTTEAMATSSTASLEALPEQREEALQQTGHLVARAMPDGGDAPVADDRTAVEQADDGLRVADVDHEQHLSPPPG